MHNALRCLAVFLLLACASGINATPAAQTAWRLLDYIAVDYAAAVEDGKIISQGEFAEMVEFSASVNERLAALPPAPAQPELLDKARDLQQAIDARSPPEAVAALARELAGELLVAYPVPMAPDAVPDLAGAAALYQQHCASCHGVSGAGDGVAGVALDPAPIDFTDRERARERSIFALYQVIEQGLEGTGMGSYAHLPADDRWALSFYIGQYAYRSALADAGERLWHGDAALRERLPDLAALVQVTPAALAAELGEEKATALTAYLRSQPQAVQPRAEGSLALARARLAEGATAYAAGDRGAARDLMLSAYLDGFEPVEAMLAARDAALMARIERAMGELRARVGDAASVADVQAQVALVDELFDQAEAALSPDRASNATAFVGALTILLREGLEALLIVIAMVAFLRKSGRVEAMPYVHAGWVGALLAGALTWGVATYLVGISGASRELTEGFAALFAAFVLLFVGIWMHGKSQAGAWRRYIREKMSHALTRRSAWFLFLLAFVVVYREVFETVLFFAALWSQGNSGAILAGAGSAALVLVVLAWVMLRFSQRLPIPQFFALSSVLVSILAVVLAGKGVAALQEAGWIAVTGIDAPRIALLGLYPTLQGVTAQSLVLAVIATGYWYNRRTASLALAQP